ncbi:MAG: MFS transporter [Deltaproteobacteria bacterium]|nr:MFS transporter [Deltaproteobacteria bacterium]
MADKENGKAFFGYWVVTGAFLAILVSSGAQFSFSIFMPALLKEFGWTRGNLSVGMTLAMVVMPIAGLAGGYLTDRIGPKWTVVIGGVIGAIAMFLLSTMQTLTQFILYYGVLLACGIALSYLIATISTVRRWFMKKAALMVAIAMSASGVGIVILTPVAHGMIQKLGWRSAYIYFGIILLVGAVIGGFFLKKDPESVGQYPDGIKPSEEEMKFRADFISRAVKWSVGDAFKTGAWWLVIIAQLGYLVAVIGLITHMITWGMKDLGIPLPKMVIIFSFVFVLSAVVGRLFSGFSSDWLMAKFGLTRKPLLYLCCFGVAVGMFLCPYVKDAQSLIWVSVIIGFSYGCGLAIFPVYLGDLFGVVNMPVLFGVMGLFVAGFGALGPISFGIAYDMMGSYNMAFLGTAILCVLCGCALYFIKQPTKAA